jgi:hypothetical protein
MKIHQVKQIIKEEIQKVLNENHILDGYEVDYVHSKMNVYANIEIPSKNPTFEDDIQIKGVGKTEEEAFSNLKQNYEKYKSINESAAATVAAAAAASMASRGISSGGGGESNPWALLAFGVLMVLPIAGLAISHSRLGEKVLDWVKYYKLNRVIDRLRKDPEVLEFIKNKKPGIQNFLKTKLTDKEQKYIKQISWGKITKGEVYEIQSLLNESHKPGDQVVYGGLGTVTIDREEKDESGNIIKIYFTVDSDKTKKLYSKNYNQFNQATKPFQNPIFNPLHENTRISINTITNLIKGLSEEELLKVIKFINILSNSKSTFTEPDLTQFPKSVGGR